MRRSAPPYRWARRVGGKRDTGGAAVKVHGKALRDDRLEANASGGERDGEEVAHAVLVRLATLARNRGADTFTVTEQRCSQLIYLARPTIMLCNAKPRIGGVHASPDDQIVSVAPFLAG